MGDDALEFCQAHLLSLAVPVHRTPAMLKRRTHAECMAVIYNTTLHMQMSGIQGAPNTPLFITLMYDHPLLLWTTLSTELYLADRVIVCRSGHQHSFVLTHSTDTPQVDNRPL